MWIDIQCSLPALNTQVKVKLSNGQECLDTYRGIGVFSDNNSVTHWMPVEP